MKKLQSAILPVLFFAFIIFSCDDRKDLYPGVRPDAIFGVSQTNIAIGQPVEFSDSSTNLPREWLWDFGDGTDTSTDTNPTHTYYAAGTYKVILTVKNYGGSDTTSRNITVGMVPVANFGAAKTSINVGENVQLNDSSKNTPNKWYWNFGDDSTSVQQNPIHAYSNTGTYTVTLIASNNFGSDTTMIEKYIIVSKAGTAPVADFIASSTNITVNNTIQFTDKSTNLPTSWSWNFGDGSALVTTKNPTHSFSAAGNYTVTLTAANSTGSHTKTQTITVKATGSAPIASFTATPTITTVGTNVTFTDNSSNTPTEWLWEFGDGTTSTLRNPTHAYSSANTYTVTLTVTNSFGNNSITKSSYIRVGKAPVAAYIGSPTTINTGEHVQFTNQATNSPTSFLWSFGDGSNSTEQNPNHTYNSAGIYTVKLTVTNDFGTNAKTNTKYIIANGTGAAITDVEGNTYNTVQIGTQMWMASDLKVKKYNDNTSIPNRSNSTLWNTPGDTGFYALNSTKVYYNWHIGNSTKNVCPTGWHMPSESEWYTLITYAGGSAEAISKLNNRSWNGNNGLNTLGFSADPTGYISENGTITNNDGTVAYWWTSSEFTNASYGWSYYDGNSHIAAEPHPKNYGYAIRCVKD